jgi:hypothetical protein
VKWFGDRLLYVIVILLAAPQGLFGAPAARRV